MLKCIKDVTKNIYVCMYLWKNVRLIENKFQYFAGHRYVYIYVYVSEIVRRIVCFSCNSTYFILRSPLKIVK